MSGNNLIKRFWHMSFAKRLTVLDAVVELSFNKILYVVWHFDKWHISPYAIRSYAKSIVCHLNKSRNRNSVVEIGCGLGGILRRLKYMKRLGLDSDSQVLKAANMVSKLLFISASYKMFSFPNDALQGKFDAIIMVNWIHHIDPVTLRKMLKIYFNDHLYPHGQIVIDTVHDSKYKFQHDINFLTADLTCTVTKLCDDRPSREVFSIIK